MTKHERYQKAEKLLRQVVEKLNGIIEHDGEDVTCYFASALDESIQQLIDVKVHMAVAENMKNHPTTVLYPD